MAAGKPQTAPVGPANTSIMPSPGFLIFALAFVTLLTIVVRVTRMRVRGQLSYARGLVVSAAFVVTVLAVWWFLTRGEPTERIVQQLILPSPMEVLKAFGPLHIEQGLVRSIF